MDLPVILTTSVSICKMEIVIQALPNFPSTIYQFFIKPSQCSEAIKVSEITSLECGHIESQPYTLNADTA